MICRISSLFLALVFSSMAGLPTSHAQGNDPDKLLQGNWKVSHRLIKGKLDTDYVGGKLLLSETEQSEFRMERGETISLKLNRKVHDEKAKSFRFTIETPEDATDKGGGGPRKGLCRVNDKGELEILEARSASQDYPTDFSEGAKAASIHWKLTKIIEPK